MYAACNPRILAYAVQRFPWQAGELEIPADEPFSVRRLCKDLRATMAVAFKKKEGGVRILLDCTPRAASLALLGSPRHLRCVLRPSRLASTAASNVVPWA